MGLGWGTFNVGLERGGGTRPANTGGRLARPMPGDQIAAVCAAHHAINSDPSMGISGNSIVESQEISLVSQWTHEHYSDMESPVILTMVQTGTRNLRAVVILCTTFFP